MTRLRLVEGIPRQFCQKMCGCVYDDDHQCMAEQLCIDLELVQPYEYCTCRCHDDGEEDESEDE